MKPKSIATKYVYVGWTPKGDGLLVLSNLDWGAFARSQGGRHRLVDGQHLLIYDDPVPGVGHSARQISDDALAAMVADNDYWRGVLALSRTRARFEENLSDVVCW